MIYNNERIYKLYCNMLNHISELVGSNDLYLTLKAIGFTDEEILNEFPNIKEG